MKRLRKALIDPYVYFLLALNLYLIYAFRNDAEDYTTIIWLYWCQSVIIGLFIFFDIISAKNLDTSALQFKDRKVSGVKGKGGIAFFFLMHYNVFHFVYLIFLATDFKFSGVDFSFFKIALLCIFLGQALQFFQRKWTPTNNAVTVQSLFILPYLRIIPMHLMILLPAFLGFNPALIFLILKMILDIVGYVLTAGYNNVADTKTLQSLVPAKPVN